MRWIVLSLVLLLAGCVSDDAGGYQPAPFAISQTSTASGDGVIGSVLVPGPLGPMPMNLPIRWSGSGRIVLQWPAEPNVWLDGEFTWEPVYPEQLPQIMADQAEGRFRVSRRTP